MSKRYKRVGQVDASLIEDMVHISILTRTTKHQWNWSKHQFHWTKPEAVAWLNLNEYRLKSHSQSLVPVAGEAIHPDDVKSLIRVLRYVLKEKSPRKTSVLERQVLTKLGSQIQSQFLSCVYGKYDSMGMIEQVEVIESLDKTIVRDFLLRENVTDSVKLLELFDSGKLTVEDIYEEEDALWSGIDEYLTRADVKTFEYEIVIPLLKSKNLEWLDPERNIN